MHPIVLIHTLGYRMAPAIAYFPAPSVSKLTTVWTPLCFSLCDFRPTGLLPARRLALEACTVPLLPSHHSGSGGVTVSNDGSIPVPLSPAAGYYSVTPL